MTHKQNISPWMELANSKVIDWNAARLLVHNVSAMETCIQDAVFHAEGDVWTHTQMVVNELQRMRGDILPERWPIAVLAALLHDVAKPETRSEEVDSTGRIRVHHYGHSRAGAVRAWEILWRSGVAREIREQVYHLIRWHQRPFHITFSSSLNRDILTFSQVGRWVELLALAKADNLGRIAPNCDETADVLNLLQQEVQHRACCDCAWPFEGDHARIAFLRNKSRSEFYTPPAPTGSKVIMLSGLPGAGKDTYARRNYGDLPQVSLDQWRSHLDVDPEDEQGSVIQAAREQARQFLRTRQPFVWNATNVSTQARAKVMQLLLDYDAEVEIHAFDTPLERLVRQNAERESAVPTAVLERLIRKWEPPSMLEAHRVVWINDA